MKLTNWQEKATAHCRPHLHRCTSNVTQDRGFTFRVYTHLDKIDVAESLNLLQFLRRALQRPASPSPLSRHGCATENVSFSADDNLPFPTTWQIYTLAARRPSCPAACTFFCIDTKDRRRTAAWFTLFSACTDILSVLWVFLTLICVWRAGYRYRDFHSRCIHVHR